MTLDELAGTRWIGTCELWEDPLGDVAQTSDCTVAVDAGVVSYTWSYQGTPHQGRLTLSPSGQGEYRDTWHQKEPIACEVLPSKALITVRYAYMDVWGWRVAVCLREPTAELVIQMTNIAPWGEEARAVRMVCQRASAG